IAALLMSTRGSPLIASNGHFWSISGTLTESCPLTFAHPLSLRRPRRRLGCRARHVNHASSSHPSKQPLPAAAFAMSVCRQSVSDSWLDNLRECLAHLVKGSGCDCLLMQAASLLDGFSFDLFPPFKNGLTAPEVDVTRRQVVQALVISTVVVVPDEELWAKVGHGVKG